MNESGYFFSFHQKSQVIISVKETQAIAIAVTDRNQE